MSLFPYIATIDDLLPHISHLPEIRVSTQPNGYVVVCAMIADDNTYGGDESMWARECRGITFDRDGKIAARPMQKFFNMNEREDTQEHLLDFSKVCRIMDKRDGSMIHPVLVDGAVVMKSKKSFDSDVATAATKFVQNIQNEHYYNFCEKELKAGRTPIFEYTAPNARIVLHYPTEELRLLHIRDNYDGGYYSLDHVRGKIPIVDDYDLRFGDPTHHEFLPKLKKHLEIDKGYEGFVIQFMNGDMVKVKTKWYLDLHHSVTFPTYRSVAQLVIDEAIDDLKSHLAAAGNNEKLLEIIHAIEAGVVYKLVELETNTSYLYDEFKHLDRKHFALATKDNPLFSLAMSMYLGKEPDFKGFYLKNEFKNNWSTDQI
ncbi:MAG: RNA ligase [Candidatus Nitrosotenuis sp.]